MKRMIVLLLLTGTIGAAGCGDDEPSTTAAAAEVTIESFNHIEPGDTQADVTEQLGAPDRTSTLGSATSERLQWHRCQDGTQYTISLRGDDVVGSQYANRPNCGP